MSIVEDNSVKEAMQLFSSILKKYEQNPNEESLAALKHASYSLAKICRESSIKRWELEDFELKPENKQI